MALQPEANLRSVLHAETDTTRLRVAGRAAVVLRFGFFYGPDAVHTREELRLARRLHLSSVLGPDDAYCSVIHLDDAADAALAALHAPGGTYNVVDDTPLTRFEHVDALARALRIRALHRLPPWLSALAGPPARTMMRSQRVSNRAFRAATTWRPHHPDAHSGWQDIVARVSRTT